MLVLVLNALTPVALAQLLIVSSAGLQAETFVESSVPPGAIGVVAGSLAGAADAWPELLPAAGWQVVATDPDTPLDLVAAGVLASDRAPAAASQLVQLSSGEAVAFLAVSFAREASEAALERAERAVREALAGVPAGVPVALVVNGDRAEAVTLLRRLPRLGLALVAGAGAGDPAPMRVGDAWLIEVPWGGAQWGETRAVVDGERFVQVEHRLVAPRGYSQRVADVKRTHGLASLPLEALLQAASAAAQSRSEPVAELRGANRAATLEIADVRLVERYGAVRAASGGVLVVLDVTFENVIPLTLVRDLEVPTEYRFNDLADHAFVVVNATRLARLAPAAATAPGHLRVTDFRIERPGERVRGNLVFEVPPDLASGDVDSLEFRLYDFAHGHLRVPLLGTQAAPTPTPLLPAVTNEIVELGVFGLELVDEFAAQVAPAGQRFAVVELLARSMFSFEVDATAFDPHAQPGERTLVGTVSDWLEAHRHLHLVVDGVHAYPPDAEQSALPDEPRFLPDVMTGGRVVFTVPADATSLMLRADFPNARLPDRSLIRPTAIELPLVGTAPEPAAHTPLWTVRDDTLEVSINAMRVEASFAGVAAGERRFVVLEVAVHNLGTRPEWFQTAEQLRYVDASGRQSAPHEATFVAPYRPTPHVWVPEAQTRVFEVAYLVPASERQPRLAYRGFTLAEIVALPMLGE